MIETYAFLVMFTVQILAISVLHPAWFIRIIRVKMEGYYSDERFTQLYPGTERTQVERFLTLYRAVNIGIAAIGLLLLGWLFSAARRTVWDDIVAFYFIVQVLPLIVVALIAIWSNKQALKRSLPEAKRTASLQRRRLFDFVSPFSVFVAVLVYVLFIAFVLYIQRDPFPGFAGAFTNIGIVTLVYVLHAFVGYRWLYGRRNNPIETRTDRLHTTGLTIKAGVYSCIVVVVFLSLSFTLRLLDLQSWKPFATSFCLVTCTLVCFMGLAFPRRKPEVDGRARMLL